MRVELMELANFCQHQHRIEEFGDGLTAIVGPNGSGKSNLLGAMRWLLTGENPNPGTQEQNVYQHADPTEQSFGRLQFSHGGVRAIVSRWLRPESRKSTLELLDEAGNTIDTLRGDKRINPHIASILGVDFDTINTIAIVAQEDIFGFLAQTPAKRAAMFQRLFRTERATEVHKAVGDHLSGITVPEVLAECDAVRQQYDDGMARLSTLRTESQQLDTAEVLRTVIQQDQSVISQYREYELARMQLSTAMSDLRSTEEQLTTLGDQITSAQENVSTLQAAVDNTGNEASRAQRLLADMERYADIEAMRVELQQGIDSLLRQQEADTPQRKPDNFHDDMVALETQLRELHNEIGHAEEFARVFQADGVAACPTCDTPATKLTKKLEQIVTELPTKITLRDELLAQQFATLSWTRGEEQRQQRRHSREVQLQSQREQLQRLERIERPTEERETLEATVRDHDEYRHGLIEYQRILQQRQTDAARLEGQCEAGRRRVEAAREAAARFNVNQQHAAAAQQRINDRTGQLQRRTWLDQELTRLEATTTALADRLASLESAAQEARILRQWGERMGAVRDIVHWGGLPTYVIRHNLERLAATTNEHLSLFQTGYTVSTDDELSFNVRFTDGTTQPAARLSGGQKVVLALTLRLALNLWVAAGLGFLALDEPTAYLDEHHIRGFEPTLDRLRAFAASRGLQCVMVTHERSLAPMFDHVIEL